MLVQLLALPDVVDARIVHLVRLAHGPIVRASHRSVLGLAGGLLIVGATHVLAREVVRMVECAALRLGVQQATQLSRWRTVLADDFQLDFAMDEAVRSIARQLRAHASHCALALRLLRHALLSVGIEVLRRYMLNVGVRRWNRLNNALGKRVLAGWRPTLQLLVIQEHRLRILVLLAADYTILYLSHARTAHGIELVDLYLGWI